MLRIQRMYWYEDIPEGLAHSLYVQQRLTDICYYCCPLAVPLICTPNAIETDLTLEDIN
jgi:hypothetical protein